MFSFDLSVLTWVNSVWTVLLKKMLQFQYFSPNTDLDVLKCS